MSNLCESRGKIQRSEAKRRYLDQTLIVPGLQARLKFWRIWLGGKLRLGWEAHVVGRDGCVTLVLVQHLLMHRGWALCQRGR